MSVLSSAWVYRSMRGALAVIFLHAGATKLLDPQAFAVLIDAYGIVPDALLMPVAVGLPLLEVVAAVGLMADIRGALAVVAALLVIFMAILVYGIRMGLDVDCGCFGPEDIEARAYHGLRAALVRDAAMLAGVIYLYWCQFTDDFVKSSKFEARESRVTRRIRRRRTAVTIRRRRKAGLPMKLYVFLWERHLMAAVAFGKGRLPR